MKVIIIGANGQIGKILTQKLAANNEYEVSAMIRNSDQDKFFKDAGAKPVIADLEGPVYDLQKEISGHDAVIFTAGSGGKTGADKTLLIDLDGAVKTMEAAHDAGVRRYLMVSAIQAHNRENWNPKIKHYFAAKHYADRFLIQSGLDYTILRPGGLTNDPGTGMVDAAKNLERGKIPREDVADVLIQCLNASNTVGRDFDLVSGKTPISEAVQIL